MEEICEISKNTSADLTQGSQKFQQKKNSQVMTTLQIWSWVSTYATQHSKITRTEIEAGASLKSTMVFDPGNYFDSENKSKTVI